MRCYIHEFQDALGNCESCGQPICNDCAERRDGKIYCPNCKDSGWLESGPPKPSSGSERQYPSALVDTKSRSNLFILGGVGALIAIFGYGITLLLPILAFAGSFDLSSIVIISLASAGLSAVAMVLMAVGYYGLYVNYENKTGILAAFFGIISMIVSIIVTTLITPVFGLSMTGFEIQQANILSLILFLLIASLISMVSSLIIGISLYQVKDVIGNRDLATVTAGLFLVSILFAGVLLIVAYLLLAILFLQAKMPETDEWLQKSKSDYEW